MLKKLLLAAVCCCFGWLATPSVSAAEGIKDLKVGVVMPSKDLERWAREGTYMEGLFKNAGIKYDLQYGAQVDPQVNFIQNMLSSGCNVLVIAAVDGASLSSVLEQAKENNVPVISYDRLIMGTDAVSLYISFDNTKVGELQGGFIRDQLGLDRPENQGKTFNLELFAGAPDDNNAQFFFDGALSVLKPYIDKGQLKVLSGQKDRAACGTERWSAQKAQERMENLISAQDYAGGTHLDAVLCSNDTLARGVAEALSSQGVEVANFPIITGQDCEVASVQYIRENRQSMSVFKDTRKLADQVVKTVQALAKGEAPETNDTATYNNGKKIVPSFLCSLDAVTKDTIKTILVDSGYYTEAELK
ncbi:MAG: sugar-binding protein [Planctomycetota bacterium]|jgi:putative multiple sugar transport system substrate-binding protein|nr:sugar-binding protein [Planctomycetota bacterium]